MAASPEPEPRAPSPLPPSAVRAWLKGYEARTRTSQMLLAAREGRVDVMEWLVESGEGDVRAPGSARETPMWGAAWGGHVEAMEWLARNGAAEEFGLSHAQVAERVGLERSSVTNLVRLTELERSIQDLLNAGSLGSGHGKALLALEAGTDRERIAKLAAEEGWSVRRLEQQAQEPRQAGSGRSAESKGGGGESDPGRVDLEKQLGEHLGTKVAVKTNTSGTKGKLVIEFYSLDHFDGLMSRLGFEMR